MPRLSDSMEEGTVLKWMKGVGDEVALGEELVEIETDKANMVFEADAAGTLIEIVAAEGDTLPIGEVIARIGEAGQEANENSSKPATASSKPKASPVARRIAAEAGLDLTRVAGSGPSGRIVKADVEAALASGSTSTEETLHPRKSPLSRMAPSASSPAQAATSAPVPSETAKGSVETVELTKLQQTVSRRMAESKATAPHFYLRSEVDMTRAFDARAELKAAAAEDEVTPSFNDMVVKACAIALREFPRANGAYRDGKWELYSRVNVGIAVAAAEALVVPTVFDADLKGLRQIATESRALAQRVRENQVTPPELSGGTFTVSNLGMYGITNFHAVINSPQAAILAVGAITERPAIADGELRSTRVMGVTLACDHRILYGADGAEFLRRVRMLLEEPLGLAL